jgi:hypothetical protein
MSFPVITVAEGTCTSNADNPPVSIMLNANNIINRLIMTLLIAIAKVPR